MKIKVIVPVTTKNFEEPTREEAARFTSPGTELNVEAIQYGTASIESSYDEALNAPGIVKMAEKAQSEGFDGILIDCMGDPALCAVREKLEIPVVGAARASMIYAAELARRFSVLAVLENMVGPIEDIAAILGLRDSLASVRYADTPVLALTGAKLMGILIEESLKAIREDGAHAIVLGCTGIMGVTESLSQALKTNGYDIPVIYPVAVSIKYLETLISLNLKQSRKTYLRPPEKETNIWEVMYK